METLELFIEGESAEDREKRILTAMESRPLVPDGCTCEGDPGFRCYPGDGECSCGTYKHHVHGLCGHVVQWG